MHTENNRKCGLYSLSYPGTPPTPALQQDGPSFTLPTLSTAPTAALAAPVVTPASLPHDRPRIAVQDVQNIAPTTMHAALPLRQYTTDARAQPANAVAGPSRLHGAALAPAAAIPPHLQSGNPLDTLFTESRTRPHRVLSTSAVLAEMAARRDAALAARSLGS